MWGPSPLVSGTCQQCHGTRGVSQAYLVDLLELLALRAILLKDLLSEPLQAVHLVLCLADDPLQSAQLGGRGTLVQQVDVNVLGEREFAAVDGLEQRRLSAAVLTEETIATAVVDLDGGIVEQDTAVEHERGGGDLDIAGGLEGGQDTGGDTVRDTELVRLRGEVLYLLVPVERQASIVVAVDGRGLGGILGGGLGRDLGGCCLLVLASSGALSITGGFRCGDHVG